MKASRAGLVLVGLLAPAALLIATGIAHFQDGIALESAFPIPLYISADYPQRPESYRRAAKALKDVNPSNGNARVALAEARYYGGDRPESTWPLAILGLAGAPAFAQGWAFYAETKIKDNARAAAQSLSQAFSIAPYDYYWAGRRAQIAARLWPVLDKNTQQQALRQVRLLWANPALHDQLLTLLTAQSGANLLAQTYKDDPDTLRTILRWVAARRRELLAQHHT